MTGRGPAGCRLRRGWRGGGWLLGGGRGLGCWGGGRGGGGG